ncbi:MAG: twin-arginine translocase TatA/TatE family subunit [Terracidiphilus sp.]
MGSLPPIQLATLGMWDTLLLMVLALVVFGPRRLPKIGRQLGKLMYEFRKASNDFKFQMEEELRNAEEADRRKKEEEERQRALAAAPPPAPPQLEATASVIPATTETQESGAPALTESPYSEGTDPNIKAEKARIETPAPPTNESADLGAAATIPHIQPPSTGETIAAERPNKVSESTSPEAERSEPAAHHG